MKNKKNVKETKELMEKIKADLNIIDNNSGDKKENPEEVKKLIAENQVMEIKLDVCPAETT